MIYDGSRYEYVEALYSEKDNVMVLSRRKYKSFEGCEILNHMWVQGDSLSRLAYEYYGDCTKWWVILEANPQYRGVIDNIKAGNTIYIPQGGDI